MGITDCEEIENSYPLTENAHRVLEWAVAGLHLGCHRYCNDVRVEHRLRGEYFIRRRGCELRVRETSAGRFEAVSLTDTEPSRLSTAASQATGSFALFMSCQDLLRG
jgi:hypothetical protein